MGVTDNTNGHESHKQSLSASLAGKDNCFGDYDDTMWSYPSYYPKSHPPTSALTVALPLQPHPQSCCLSQRSQPSPPKQPAKKPCFTTLSNEELEGLSKSCVLIKIQKVQPSGL